MFKKIAFLQRKNFVRNCQIPSISPINLKQEQIIVKLALIEHAHLGKDFPCELCAQKSGDVLRIIKLIRGEDPISYPLKGIKKIVFNTCMVAKCCFAHT